jgi:hypothetical protein
LPVGAGRETHPAATELSEQHKSGPLCGLVALPKISVRAFPIISDLLQRLLRRQFG